MPKEHLTRRKMAKRMLKPDDFFTIREASSPACADKGFPIAFTVLTVDAFNNRYRRNLWFKKNFEEKAYQFTHSPTGDDYSPAFHPHKDQIAFISTRTGKPQVWLMDLCGGEARPLTELKNGVQSFRWSPDGERIALITRLNQEEGEVLRGKKKQHRFKNAESQKRHMEEEKRKEELKNDPRVVERIVYRTGTSYLDDRRTHIVLLHPKSGKVVPITSGVRDYEQPEWDAGSTSLLTTANLTGDEDNNVSRDIIRIDLATGQEKHLTRDDRSKGLPHLSPDNRYCYFISLPAERPSCCNASLHRLDLESGSEREITGALDREIQYYEISPDGGTAYFSVTDSGSVKLYYVDLESGALELLIDEAQFIHEFTLSAGGRHIVMTLSRPDIPADIFSFDIRKRKMRRVSAVNQPFLRRKHISYPEELWWKSGDKDIQGWLMKPAHFNAKKKYPLIVQIHGGPHVMWGNSFWLEFQNMVERGYLVYFCNPRGSDGYGKDFKGAIYQNWGVEDSKDILLGLDEVSKMGCVDEQRLYVTGGSYGGFMTAWIIGHDNRFRAAVSQRGVYNLTSFYGCSDAQLLIEWEFDTFPWDNPDLLWKHSPLAYVPQMRTPLLIIHSELDYRAPINTAEELYVALKKLKREVTFVRYPREGHELSRSGEPRHRVDRLKRIIGWFDTHQESGNE